MRHGSLFSGIGGFDLASEWMSWENVFHCEWNEFGQKVLNHYWPKAISYHDITKTDFSIHRGKIDIITGGFPCQPYSMAGKRLGKEDERHLWPEMLRAIREIQPTWVVGENVFGLVNWNGGLVFNEVQTDLEAEGYEVQPYVLPAASVNAPHRRDRIWFVAYSKSCADSRDSGEVSRKAKEENRGRIKPSTSSKQQVQLPAKSSSLFGIVKNYDKDGRKGNEWKEESNIRQQRNSCAGDYQRICTNNEKVGIASDSKSARTRKNIRRLRSLLDRYSNGIQNATDTRKFRLEQCENTAEMAGRQGEVCEKRNKSSFKSKTNVKIRNASDSKSSRQQTRIIGQREEQFRRRNISMGSRQWSRFPTVSPICSRNDGLSDRLDSITFSKWRNESIKAGGNAIVPQVVHQIFKSIEQYETNRQA